MGSGLFVSNIMDWAHGYRTHPGGFSVVKGELGDVSGDNAQPRSAPKGALLYEADRPCSTAPFLLSGVVQVFKLRESGRENTLYRVKPGQMCVLSSDSFPCLSTFLIPRIPKPEARLFAPVLSSARCHCEKGSQAKGNSTKR